MTKFRFKLGYGLFLLLVIARAAHADPAALCKAQGGTALSGTIVGGPFFIKAKHRQDGVALSHTKILLRDENGQIYDIRADNVFAAGYADSPDAVPAPLSALHAGEKLSLCGKLYKARTGRMGMDWVHTNCGARPRYNAPNGWLALATPEMVLGPNLEGAQDYCYLW